MLAELVPVQQAQAVVLEALVPHPVQAVQRLVEVPLRARSAAGHLLVQLEAVLRVLV